MPIDVGEIGLDAVDAGDGMGDRVQAQVEESKNIDVDAELERDMLQ